MGVLEADDLEALLDVAATAYSFDSLNDFRTGLLPELARLVPGDTASYNEIDIAAGRVIVALDPPDVTSAAVEEAFAATAHEHPGIALAAQGDHRTRRLSDFLSVGELHQLALYQEVYRPLGTEDQLYFCIPAPNVVGIVINRSRRSFKERDRQVMERLRPHLARAYVQARERERAQALIAAQEAGLEDHGGAVVLLDDAGAVIHASPLARQLLAAYFGQLTGGLLPSQLADWLAAGRLDWDRSAAVWAPRGRLRVRALRGRTPKPWRALLLEEHETVVPEVDALLALGLTRRQAEVLRLLTYGRSNQQIADELFCSPATVRKHLEHIYTRLQVQSRGQAIAKAMAEHSPRDR